MSSATLQDDPSVESFFNVVETETLALFEHYSFGFLEDFDAFAPAEAVRTREHEPPGETTMRFTRDALAVEQPIWMVGDSAYDTLD